MTPLPGRKSAPCREALTLQYDKVIFSSWSQPSKPRAGQIGRRVTVVDYPDGRLGAPATAASDSAVWEASTKFAGSSPRLRSSRTNSSVLRSPSSARGSCVAQPERRSGPRRRDQRDARLLEGRLSFSLRAERAGARPVKQPLAVFERKCAVAAVGGALRYTGGCAPAPSRPTPTRVTFLNGTKSDIFIGTTLVEFFRGERGGEM